MNGLLESLNPLIKNYRIEIILILASFFIAITSILLYINNSRTLGNKPDFAVENEKPPVKPEKKILVDLSGAVEKPDVYEVTSGARLKDVLILAGGLSFEADRQYVDRNFNLAKTLTDQEKIYIPTTDEVKNKDVNQISRTLTNTQDNTSIKIDINTASIDELDTLPGIGKVTAQKIIQNRPYPSVEDLLNRKIVNKSVYEGIKESIVIN